MVSLDRQRELLDREEWIGPESGPLPVPTTEVPLLAVGDARNDGQPIVWPTFQLDDKGEQITEVAAVIARLRDVGMSEWAIWSWFFRENPWTERCPVELVVDADWVALHDLVDKFENWD